MLYVHVIVYVLLYADDTKMYTDVHSYKDCKYFQNNVNRFVH